MALVKSFNEFKPNIEESCYLSETATIIGNVVLASECSVWFGAVLRGDVGSIIVGKRSNIQDNVVVHSTKGKSIVEIGENVTIGHNSVIHGAIICNNVLVGMGAVVMDNVHVGEGATIAAGAVVLSNTEIEPYTLWAGIPAKCIALLDIEKAIKDKAESADHYIEYAKMYRNK